MNINRGKTILRKETENKKMDGNKNKNKKHYNSNNTYTDQQYPHKDRSLLETKLITHSFVTDHHVENLSILKIFSIR